MADEDVRELEALGSFVHGALCAGHSLGIVYNARAARYGWATFHLICATVSFVAAREHARDARKPAGKVVRFQLVLDEKTIDDEIESALRGDLAGDDDVD